MTESGLWKRIQESLQALPLVVRIPIRCLVGLTLIYIAASKAGMQSNVFPLSIIDVIVGVATAVGLIVVAALIICLIRILKETKP